MLTPEERVVAKAIGAFYLQKCNNDYDKARDEIVNLLITDLKVDPEKITLTVGRPGRLIGKWRENIEALAKALGRKVHIIENDLVDAMIPYREPTDEELAQEEMWDDLDYDDPSSPYPGE